MGQGPIIQWFRGLPGGFKAKVICEPSSNDDDALRTTRKVVHSNSEGRTRRGVTIQPGAGRRLSISEARVNQGVGKTTETGRFHRQVAVKAENQDSVLLDMTIP